MLNTADWDAIIGDDRQQAARYRFRAIPKLHDAIGQQNAVRMQHWSDDHAIAVLGEIQVLGSTLVCAPADIEEAGMRICSRASRPH